MSAVSYACPAGHRSATADYCDTCGAAIAPPAEPTAAAVAATCANCGSGRDPGDAFCEVCGLDFATGQLPAAPPPPDPVPAQPAPASAPGWVAVVEADRAFFEANQPEQPGTVDFPAGDDRREVALTGDEVLIGRRSDTRGVFPEIDLAAGVEDPAVSRRHAVLRRRGDGWVVVDQGSTNGTRVKGAAEPVAPGQEVPLTDGDHLHVGAWTRITLRRVPEGARR